LIFVQGVVSKVVDADAGIYLLDGTKVKLVTSYLRDICCEMSSCCKRLEDGVVREETEECQVCEACNDHKCKAANLSRYHNRFLMEGDNVTIFYAHYDKREGQVCIICCGRSLVVNNR